jgi:putative transposase
MLDRNEKSLSTPELVQGHNKVTLTDRLLPYAHSTHKQKSSASLEGDSTSNEKNFLPYWNESCKVLSKELLSLIKTDWQDSGSTFLSGLANSLTAKSWFSTKQTYLQKQKCLKTSLPFSTVFQVDSTDSGNLKLRCKKIKIYPSSELKKVWNKWLAACRFCYNLAIDYQKKNGKVARGKLRNIIMQSDLPDWVRETPCHIRQNAIFDAHQAYRASKDCQFRSCHSPRQTIKFNNSNYSNSTWYSKLTKGLTFNSSEPVPIKTEYASQLIKTKSGEWFGVFLEPVEFPKSDQQTLIALDPGVRTFLTGFDGQKFIEIGQGDMGRITRLCQHLDNLMSRISKNKSSRQRKKMRLAAARMRKKIRNLVDECHKQTANFLAKTYKFVLLPKFETSEMTKKNKRKITTKTARAMLSWSHYRFKQVLKNKAELCGSHVLDVTEEYTSKTCTACGHIHRKLGGSKVFKCPVCNHTIGRDFNGALGIFLKALRDTSVTFLSDAIVVQPDNISRCTA